MRVLHIVTYMGRGGLETMLMNYYRHIDRSKVQFDFLVHRDFEADYDKEIEELGGRIYRIGRLNPFSLGYLKELDAFFEEHQEYKVIHSHLDCMAGIPLKYAKKNGVPVRIAHAHNSNQAKDKKYLLKLLYKKKIPQVATHLFACGEEAGKWMFEGASFQVLNNAIDMSKYRYDANSVNKIRDEFGIEKDCPIIGHVGRFAPQKNHKFVVAIFTELIKLIPNAKLMLVGDGELKREIEEQVKRLRIENCVIFTGVRSDIPEILRAMDIFLLPSLHEGIPVSVIEAQAAGLPCLISDKVPIECKKTNLVAQISLSEEIEVWIKQMIEFLKIERVDTYEEIRRSGFDIKENARKLEEFYLQECENINRR